MECRPLQLTIHNARDLKDINRFTKMDPYVIVSINNDPRTKQKTRVHNNGGTNPSWEFPMNLTVDESALQSNKLTLVFKIKEESKLGDRDIGEVNANLKELLDRTKDSSVPVSYAVTTPSGKSKGTLNFSYKFGDKYTYAPPAQPNPPLQPMMAYPPSGDKKPGEPVMAYPPQQAGYPVSGSSSSSGYPYPPAGQYPYPQQAAPAPGGYYGQYPPPGQQPGYGYPPPGQYGYPPPGQYPGHGYPVGKPQKKKSGMGGLGLGLGAGLLGGLLVGEMIDDVGDAAAYADGYADAAGDVGDFGGFDF